ncbi:MAG: hypothetical protein WA860_09000 [Acidimicrobiales bacterium]
MLVRRCTAATSCALAVLSLAAFLPFATTPASGAQSTTVTAFDAPYSGSPTTTGSAVVAVTAGANGDGYYVLRANGEVDAYGATSYGSLSANSLPVGITATGIALDATTGGYWILSSNGSVKAFNAPSYGETLVPSGGWGQHPAAVAIAAAPSGAGYYVLRANGAVYGYGVKSHGSLAGPLHYGATAPVLAVAIAVDSATGGYWIATSTGGVAAFDASGDGVPATPTTAKYNGNPVTALAALPSGSGYYVLHANGEVDGFDAPSHGSIAASRTLPEGGFASALAIDATTGGYYEAIDDTPLDGYYNPLRGLTSLLPQEVDQGVDYCASGPIYAVGDGVVANVYSSGWPSGVFISYRLTTGPAKGLYVYDAEDVTPTVSVGEHVTPTTIVGQLHDAATCLETGWADPPGPIAHAAAHLEFNGENSTAYGLNFNTLLVALGSRPGLPQPDGPPGPLPTHWPTW